jgi:hypothetical protein
MDVGGFNTARLNICILDFSKIVLRLICRGQLFFSQIVQLLENVIIAGMIWYCDFGGLGVSVLASGTQVRGFKPDRCRIFKGGKVISTPSFGRELKPWVPCRRFVACKRSLNVPWKSAFRQNYRSYSPPISSNFRLWSAERVGRRGGIWWPKFERPVRAVQKAG